MGLLLGLRWARLAYGTTKAWDAKVLWSVAIWAVCFFYLAVRYGLLARPPHGVPVAGGVRAGAVQLHRGQFLFQI
ncbi:MAG: cytochrome c biogenesis protein CcsA, partial [Elusimicrobia bacterium]|nr:cytochrome c biogenesis protein CcsA [Elusimicrobiota bacterium]